MSSPDRQTTDPLPFPSSPRAPDTLSSGGRPAGATTDAAGIPFAGQTGVAAAGSGTETDIDADGTPQAASTSPAGAGAAAPAPPRPASTSAAPSTTPAAPAGADGTAGHDDGLLESIGKAISSPIRGAAEDEEPK